MNSEQNAEPTPQAGDLVTTKAVYLDARSLDPRRFPRHHGLPATPDCSTNLKEPLPQTTGNLNPEGKSVPAPGDHLPADSHRMKIEADGDPRWVACSLNQSGQTGGTPRVEDPAKKMRIFAKQGAPTVIWDQSEMHQEMFHRGLERARRGLKSRKMWSQGLGKRWAGGEDARQNQENVSGKEEKERVVKELQARIAWVAAQMEQKETQWRVQEESRQQARDAFNGEMDELRERIGERDRRIALLVRRQFAIDAELVALLFEQAELLAEREARDEDYGAMSKEMDAKDEAIAVLESALDAGDEERGAMSKEMDAIAEAKDVIDAVLDARDKASGARDEERAHRDEERTARQAERAKRDEERNARQAERAKRGAKLAAYDAKRVAMLAKLAAIIQQLEEALGRQQAPQVVDQPVGAGAGLTEAPVGHQTAHGDGPVEGVDDQRGPQGQPPA